MKARQVFSAVIFLLFSASAFSQRTDTLIHKLDSLHEKTDSAGAQLNNTERAAYNENTKMTAQTYFILLGSDFKQQITKPFHMSGKEWRAVGIYALSIAAISLADEPVQKFALRLRDNSAGLRNTSAYVTRFGGQYEAYVLIAMGAYGYLFRNIKMQTTTLLATQSYITSAVMAAILKNITGRQRPNYYNVKHFEPEPAFHGPFFRGGRDVNGKRINTSFPSGHTTAAFSAATVFAMEYKNKPIIPILAYGAATLIGVSRIVENKHWLTDVLVGATLGYLTGRQVVNNYHRYSKLKAPAEKKNTVSFNLQYENGVLMPGIVYRFR